jgi:hypothetical protein
MASDRHALEKTNRGGMLGVLKTAFRALGRSLSFVNFIFGPYKPGNRDLYPLGTILPHVLSYTEMDGNNFYDHLV